MATIRLPAGHQWKEVPGVPGAWAWKCTGCGGTVASPLDDPEELEFEEGDGSCEDGEPLE